MKTNTFEKFEGNKTDSLNKRPIGPVSLTWFLPYIFLYQSMTIGCYMPNINAFRPAIHGKKDVSSFLLYKPI